MAIGQERSLGVSILETAMRYVESRLTDPMFNPAELCVLYAQMASAWHQLGVWDPADRLLEQGAALAHQLRDSEYAPKAWASLAEEAGRINKISQAKEWFDFALDAWQKSEDPFITLNQLLGGVGAIDDLQARASLVSKAESAVEQIKEEEQRAAVYATLAFLMAALPDRCLPLAERATTDAAFYHCALSILADASLPSDQIQAYADHFLIAASRRAPGLYTLVAVRTAETLIRHIGQFGAPALALLRAVEDCLPLPWAYQGRGEFQLRVASYGEMF
jgi:hypothetical protein